MDFYGIYQNMSLPKSARPGSPLVPSGRVEILLDDGKTLALETHQLGMRSEVEKERLVGQRVWVRGILVPHAQLWGTPEQASIVMDAIKAIEKLEVC